MLIVLLLIALAFVTGRSQRHVVQAASSRPGLSFTNAGTQSTLGAAYTMALVNLLTINTVPYDNATYNSTGFLTNPPGTFLRAGAGYQQPWTRDASINSWNAASLLSSDVARNTLWSVVKRQSNGSLIVQQDDQWWDQVIWISAAWNHYLVNGDTTFLNNAYQTAVNTLNQRRATTYNTTYGLFRGASFFNDGIAGYPAPPADSTESLGPGSLSYPAVHQIMPLSTNLLHYDAYRSAALMASALGKPATEVSAHTNMANALKTTINSRFWNSTRGLYGYFLHSNGQLDQSVEVSGHALAILFDVASASQTTSIMQNLQSHPYGTVSIYPHFARYNDARPGRHNAIIWPMVQGYWAHAAAKARNQTVFAREVGNLARLANTSGQFAEIYNAHTGAIDGGWQTGFHWGSEPHQTWSATAYLRMIYHGLFGMRFTGSGVAFEPLLPTGWGDVTLSGLRYRGMTLNITLRGAGTTISSFRLNGVATTSYTLPNTLSGTQNVEITLSGGTAQPPLPGSPAFVTLVNRKSGKCADVANAGTGDGTAVQQWTCNNSTAQQWQLIPTDGGYFQLVGRGSGKLLDVAQGSTADGALVQIWSNNGSAAQQWAVQVTADGWARLVARNSGKALSVVNGGVADGDRLRIWSYVSGLDQQWRLQPVGPVSLIAKHSGKCADVANAGTADGTNVQQWTCNNSTAQKWTFQHTDNGYYRVISQNSGKALEVQNGSTADGANVQIWTAVNVNHQQWRLELQTDGYFRLAPRHSNSSLDVADASNADGANIRQWGWNTSSAQRFKLMP